MARKRTVAVVVGLVAGLLAVDASAVAQDCDRRGSPDADRVVTTPSPTGYNVTELYGEGVYRVERCDPRGELVEGQTVAPILEPDGDVALVPSTYSTPRGDASVLYGDPRDRTWARAWNAAGAGVKSSVIDPPRGVDVDAPESLPEPMRGPGPAAGGAQAAQAAQTAQTAQAGGRCTNGAFVRYGPLSFWPRRGFGYRINRASFAGGARTRSAIVAGHGTWNDTRNDCGFGDRSNIAMRYLGVTTARVRAASDGRSVIDKGEVANLAPCGNSRVAIACSFLHPGQSAGPFTENDQRYDNDFKFTTRGIVGGAYDYWHIAAHESGHSIGMDHSTASAQLTMYPQATQSSTYWRTLALGDVLGMRDIYP